MKGVLEKMPPPEIREEQRVLGEAPKKPRAREGGGARKPARHMTEDDMLLDLVGGSDPGRRQRRRGRSKGGVGQQRRPARLDILGSGSDAPAAWAGAGGGAVERRRHHGPLWELPAPRRRPPRRPRRRTCSPVGEAGQRVAPSPSPGGHEAFRRGSKLVITLQLSRERAVRSRRAGAVPQRRRRGLGPGVAMQAAVLRSQRLQVAAHQLGFEIGPGQDGEPAAAGSGGHQGVSLFALILRAKD